MKVYSVRDKAAQTFGQPFFCPANGVAVRGFTGEVNRAAEDNMLYKHPADYSLFYVGEFNVDSGVVTPAVNGPELLITGDSAKT